MRSTVLGAATGPALAADDLLARPVYRARHLAQRELAERREVLLGEKVRQRRLHFLGAVDLAFRQPLAQVFGGDVDVHDLVGDAPAPSPAPSRAR